MGVAYRPRFCLNVRRGAAAHESPIHRSVTGWGVAVRYSVRHTSQDLGQNIMDIDTEKVDAAVLGLLYLTLHQERRAWKSFDWDAMSRLHAKGLTHDPVNKAKSVALTDEGLKEAQRSFHELFTEPRHQAVVVQYGTSVVEARPAEGVTGVLCHGASGGPTFFRVYGAEGAFTDYTVRHEELAVTIAPDAMASFYILGEEPVLDHSPQVLGLQRSGGHRAPGA